MLFWKIPLAAAICYLLGNINLAIPLSRSMTGKDIREQGSGNAGTANVFRVMGLWPALAVLAMDTGKAMLGVWIGSLLLGVSDACFAFCGAAALLGHIFPCFFGFKGGKGVATLAGVFALWDWRVFCCMLAVHILLVLLTRYMSVAALSALLTGPGFTALFRMAVDGVSFEQALPGIFAAFFFGAVLVLTHIPNIERLIRGNESKIFGKR